MSTTTAKLQYLNLNGEDIIQVVGQGGNILASLGLATQQTSGALGFTLGTFLNESFTDNITALAGGTKPGTLITTQTSRITTAVSAGDSVSLPASAPGLELVVINHAANPVTVYGLGTDKIDDIATATGVSQMANSFVIYSCVTAGNWYSEGLANGFAGGLQTISTLDTITAAGANQGTATVLPSRMAYNVTTVAAGTGVLLPPSVTGAEVAVANNGANALKIYPNGSEQINALGASVAFSESTATITIFYCFTAGQWWTK
jgi:hypothetical protein